MRKPPHNALIALAGTLVGAALVLSPAGAGIRHAFVSEHVDTRAVPRQAELSSIPPPPADSNAPKGQRAAHPPATRAELKAYQQRKLLEQRKFWGWTLAREAQARRIFASDRVVQSFFAHRPLKIESTGPWNDERSRRVLGGLLKVSVRKPIYGTHRIPAFTSIRRGTFKMFRVDVAGARKFHVIVSFARGRVAEISPLLEGSVTDRG